MARYGREYLERIREGRYWLFLPPLLFFLFFVWFIYELRPVDTSDFMPRDILIEKGNGINSISQKLHANSIIRSPLAFKLYAIASFKALNLMPGLYALKPAMTTPEVVLMLSAPGRDEISALIPEGKTLKALDGLLGGKGVIVMGSLIKYGGDRGKNFEGFLFPDTYRFLNGSEPEDIIKKMTDNFKSKALPLFTNSEVEGSIVDFFINSNRNLYDKLILASLLEKEIPDFADRKIVAGILLKRISAGWPLQVDASVCYLKAEKCYPLTPLDLKIDSPYNTYLYKGLPPAPIGNPGLEAITAALQPEASPYWFYLTDPRSKKTIFAKTLEEHARNREKYLK